MSLDGFLAIIAIIIGLYALAGSVQRKSLMMFLPVKIFFAVLIVSALMLICRIAASTYGYVFFKWSDLLTALLPFVLPMN